jgi:ABC-type transport system involved in cytochrome c biogenesis permease subunit
MKKWLPWIVVAVFAGWLIGTLRMPSETGWAYDKFGGLPLIANGRVQPFDSLARNTLLQLRAKQTANLEPWKDWYEKPKIIPATEWLLTVMTKPEVADTWPEFRIDNPDVKGLLALPPDPNKANHLDGKSFSWVQIQPKLSDLERETARAGKIDASKRNPYDQALIKLWNNQEVYNRLKGALGPAATGNLDSAMAGYVQKIDAGRVAYMAYREQKEYDPAALGWFMDQMEAPLVVPPAAVSPHPQWEHAIESVIQTANGGAPPNFALQAYNRISRAYLDNNPSDFNVAVAEYHALLAGNFSAALKKGAQEQYFNFIEPFYKAMVLFVTALLFVLAYWLKPARWDWLRITAVGLVGLALVVHTAGLIFRMHLEGRPPVTNLYSSAIFIGWGATVLGLVLESFWRNSIGVMVSSIIGFITLIIAHHLALGGDTMEMMRAVLDTNFWLATHVVVVTLGYASTFVAGILAVIFIIQGVFTRALTTDLSKSLSRMIYGIVCFATLFSFVGTVLGGIWADQSWGRFWGWDPKENGALIIVLWNALVLHARWGGMIRERGMAVMAIVGNIVTSWSWFGVNMLGIGLHSYGFTSAAFNWLMAFVASQLVLVTLGCLPKAMWMSFRGPAT